MVRLQVAAIIPNLNEVWNKAQGFTNLLRNKRPTFISNILGEVKVLAVLREAVGVVFLDAWFPPFTRHIV